MGQRIGGHPVRADGLLPRVHTPHGALCTAGTHAPQVRQLAFDRGRQAGNDGEPGPLGFEPLDQRMVVKPFVRIQVLVIVWFGQ